MRILKEERTFVIVQIKWDKKCLRDREIMKQHVIS